MGVQHALEHVLINQIVHCRYWMKLELFMAKEKLLR